MLVKNTLTEAMVLRPKPGAVGLILSLEGAAYYIFHSYQTRDQVASSSAGGKAALHNQLLAKVNGTDYAPLSAVAHQAEYHRLLPVAREAAAATAMDADGRHAEEVMIESWDACTADFISRRNRMPTKAEVFLTYCPCQMTNALPSLARTIDNLVYPASCAAKLPLFCASGDRVGMKWSIFYDAPFGGVPGVVLNAGNLQIGPLPNYIGLP